MGDQTNPQELFMIHVVVATTGRAGQCLSTETFFCLL